MSKQTNEQDEQKAPSAKDQDDKGQEAGAKGKPGSGGDKSRPQRGSSSSPSAAGKAGEKPPTPPADDAPASQGKSATPVSSTPAADKSTAATPSSDKASGKPADSDKPSAAKPENAKPAPTGGKGGDAKPAASGKTPASDKSGSGKPGGDTAKAAPAGGGGTPSSTGGGAGKGGSRAAGVLALILVLFLGIGAGLFAWNTWGRLDTQQQRLAELEERAGSAASAEEVAGLREQLESGERQRDAELTEAIEAMQGEFASYRSEVDAALDQVLEELSREQEPDAGEWLHAEAAYLLRLASQRLQLEGDVEGAAALLRTADERLAEADNPALLSVRRAIASELSILAGVPEVDRTGLYLALNSVQERLAQLPLSRELEEIPARSGIEEAPSGGWQDQLSRFGQELKDLIVIRHHDEALEGLIAPEQESYLRQSARLVLEQAQLALLEEEQALYEASLDKALTLVENYYDTESSEVQAVVERLQELKGEAIQPELPDISGSHEALQEFIERRFGSRDEGGDEA
ncbi:uroporphyrinogen-III C-methyltransferase [Billgrantia antri]|uniref:Uroporphyrinogen-III C-methyltransferase n=1 Tax=Billgrantia antri TaxID=2846777 RepID=A0ABS6ZST3_9GAMM|nr:uroporphyrinogen-III C-methyltransferase [Halomonas antri]MBW6393104.1 uroporphyrinogen-III C-methyltransferase [Halomonas antri]